MKPIKNKDELSNERRKEFERLFVIAKTKELSDEESQKLLDEIRGGNEGAIQKLVNSFEIIILKVARQIPTEMLIEEMIEIGKGSLMKLAESELGSTSRERFFRFSAWYVRQALLKEEINRE